MEEMENKLNAILNDPNMMQQIMSLSQTMGQQSQAPPSEPAPMPPIDLSMVQKLSGLAGQGNVDKKQQDLLRALGPYISQQRLTRLERAMRAAKMAAVATSVLGPLRKGR